MTRPETCPKCSDRWRSYGPYGRLECPNEHVFIPNDAGTFTLVDYPDFDDGQVRDAEVELYRTGRVDRVPDRPAALRLLRREHDEQRDYEVNDPYCGDQILKMLAVPFSDRPGYLDSWRP